MIYRRFYSYLHPSKLMQLSVRSLFGFPVHVTLSVIVLCSSQIYQTASVRQQSEVGRPLLLHTLRESCFPAQTVCFSLLWCVSTYFFHQLGPTRNRLTTLSGLDCSFFYRGSLHKKFSTHVPFLFVKSDQLLVFTVKVLWKGLRRVEGQMEEVHSKHVADMVGPRKIGEKICSPKF